MERPNVKLGDKVRDTISGFEGIVVCISEWLNGCQRITIQPKKMHDDKPVGNYTFDAEQIEKVEEAPKREAVPSGGPSIPPTRNSDPS